MTIDISKMKALAAECKQHSDELAQEIAMPGTVALLKYSGAAIDSLLSELEAREAKGWQPIETAPKDGTPIVMFARYAHATASVVVIASWLEGYGMWINQSFSGGPFQQVVPSHWMPRPAFPRDVCRAGEDR
ncbi:hypothetical protein AAB988_29660 [Burkholderia contaminans]|uniref:hypothetical protein n=1 Tax=Burkholderia contaminans TaxID=488447 RepID=UPI00310E697E